MRVLVVEDEPDIAEALTWGLRAEGYVVDVADNGVDGLWKATESPHDVIVLDVMLPGMDGYQVCRTLRERGIWTPILMLTAMDEDLDHAEGLDSGADDYLPKPFSYPVLLAHLRSLTRRALGARPAVLATAGLALDPATRTATRDGTVLDLTAREVAVLEYLLRAAGRVVSKTELLEHCWDVHFEGDPAAVEVLMHRLRRKIESPGPAGGSVAGSVGGSGGGSVVETVRGQGYVIRERS
jgi:DNA-binding response OmpR family regulator